MTSSSQPWYRQLYLQVLVAVLLGIFAGYLWPAFGKSLQPLATGFINLIKMIIAPIIFCTVVHGIASMSDLRKLGRIGLKTLVYFEVISTLALIIGLVSVNVFQPGAGFNADPRTLDPKIAENYASQAHSFTAASFLLNIIPASFFGAFAEGNLLQVLFLAVLTGFAVTHLGEPGRQVLHFIELASKVFFGIMKIVVHAAPLGAFGAMAFTVGSYGVHSLNQLVELLILVYATAAFFIIVVLGLVARWCGFSLFRFLYYIRDELFLVLGTSSSETALPSLIEKTERLGCAESTVGLVIPLGYSFNLDGTNIYMTMATVFLAQATNTHFDLSQQITLLFVAMLSSKGASGGYGRGFITLAATLAVMPSVPVASLALLVGIDRFMSGMRSLTNLVGNGVATLVISRWEGEISAKQLNAELMACSSGAGEKQAEPVVG